MWNRTESGLRLYSVHTLEVMYKAQRNAASTLCAYMLLSGSAGKSMNA